MGYSRKNTKKGKRRMRKTFSKKRIHKRVNRRRGGCTSCKSKQKGGSGCTTGAPSLSDAIFERNTSNVPYTN